MTCTQPPIPVTLDPCPFCGGSARKRYMGDCGTFTVMHPDEWVECSVCLASTQRADESYRVQFKSPEEAWNTRAQPTPDPSYESLKADVAMFAREAEAWKEKAFALGFGDATPDRDGLIEKLEIFRKQLCGCPDAHGPCIYHDTVTGCIAIARQHQIDQQTPPVCIHPDEDVSKPSESLLNLDHVISKHGCSVCGTDALHCQAFRALQRRESSVSCSECGKPTSEGHSACESCVNAAADRLAALGGRSEISVVDEITLAFRLWGEVGYLKDNQAIHIIEFLRPYLRTTEPVMRPLKEYTDAYSAEVPEDERPQTIYYEGIKAVLAMAGVKHGD